MKRLSTKQDKQSLITLYNLCFGGEEEFCKRFFDNVWCEHNTAVIEKDGKIVCMTQMMPLILTDGNRKFSAYYIYALCTHPDYRGRSLAKQLLEFCENENKDCDFVVLIAGNKSLCNYYEKLGFKRTFGFKKFSVDAKNFHIPYEETKDYKKVIDIYEKNFKGIVHNFRTELDTQLNLTCSKAKIFCSDDSYCIAEIGNENIRIAEAVGKNADRLAAKLAFDFGFKSAEVVTHGDELMLGMAKSLHRDVDFSGYINLLFN